MGIIKEDGTASFYLACKNRVKTKHCHSSSINPIIYETRLNVEFSHIEKANNTFLQAGNLRVHARHPTNSAGFCKFKIEYSLQHPAEIFASCRIL